MSNTPEMIKLAETVTELQKDMAQIGTLVERLDVTIEKLTEVSSTVSQLLAVQGNRLDFQERSVNKLEELIDKRKTESDDSFKGVYLQISKVEKDLQEDLEDTSKNILKEIKSLRDDGNKQHDQINERMTRLERWMWVVIGGGTIMAGLISNLNFSNIF